MMTPRQLRRAAKRMEDENLRFRTFLKIHADEEELDRQFSELHRELFADYDCCKCANCCRKYSTSLCEEEITSIAAFLGLERQDFAAEYLTEGEEGPQLSAPCRFLGDNGTCAIQDYKPEECRDFPYTDRPERLYSLYSVISNAEVCPVVFEMLERLKKLYGFRR